MEFGKGDKIWFVAFVIWVIMWLGPGLLLVNRDVFVFGMPLLWVWAILGWGVGLILLRIAGYKLKSTNVEWDEEV